MPLISQILLDAIIDPEFLYLPRKLLMIDATKAPLGANDGEAPHLSLINDILSDGIATSSEVFLLSFLFLKL